MKEKSWGLVLCLLLVNLPYTFATDRDSARVYKYYLGLAACGGGPAGHSFVVWGKQYHPDSAIHYRSYGFYPQHHTWPNHFKSLVFKVPGEVLEESGRGSLETMRGVILIEVDSSIYYKAEIMKEEWKKKRFKLFTNDCVTFVQKVGEQTRLAMPPRRFNTLTPKKYLKKMLARNQTFSNKLLSCDKCCLYK